MDDNDNVHQNSSKFQRARFQRARRALIRAESELVMALAESKTIGLPDSELEKVLKEFARVEQIVRRAADGQDR